MKVKKYQPAQSEQAPRCPAVW